MIFKTKIMMARDCPISTKILFVVVMILNWNKKNTLIISNTVNLATENRGLETPENLAWPNFFGTGRISWVIPIIKEKWGYKPPKITQ